MLGHRIPQENLVAKFQRRIFQFWIAMKGPLSSLTIKMSFELAMNLCKFFPILLRF